MDGSEFSPVRLVAVALACLCISAFLYAVYRWGTSPADEGYAKQTRWFFLAVTAMTASIGGVGLLIGIGASIGALL